MATGPIETHLHRSFNWENGAPGPREGQRGRSARCGNGLFAQCVRLRSEINPQETRRPQSCRPTPPTTHLKPGREFLEALARTPQLSCNVNANVGVVPGLEVHARKGRLARRIPTDEPKPPRILEQPVLDPLEASRATVSAAYVERDAQGVLAPTRKRHVAARGSPSFTWFGRRDVFNTEIVADDGANTWTPTSDPIEFPKSKGHGWRAYVEATRLEITCGEAPFVCSRYDTVTGDELPVSERVGFLDRKLRVVTEKTKTRKEWVRRALDALRATYGFEYQGDNLLIARVNVLETFVEHLRNRWGSGPQQDELEQAAWIVSWNFWQMNGFTDAVPTNKMGAEVESTLGTFEEPEPEPMQPSLFDLFDDVFPDETTEETKEEEPRETVPLCVIYDWQNGEPFEFAALKGEAAIMGKKFYAVIGNPQISFQWRNKILAIRPMHRPSITSLWTRRSRFPTRWSLSLPLDSYLTPAQPQRPGTGRCLTTPISK